MKAKEEIRPRSMECLGRERTRHSAEEGEGECNPLPVFVKRAFLRPKGSPA